MREERATGEREERRESWQEEEGDEKERGKAEKRARRRKERGELGGERGGKGGGEGRDQLLLFRKVCLFERFAHGRDTIFVPFHHAPRSSSPCFPFHLIFCLFL